MKNIIFIAPPAAGKGTQSELLVKEFNYEHISTGDLLRVKQNDGSLLGNKIKELLASGNLIDDEIVTDLLKEKLASIKGPYILDGYPRNLNQAQTLENILSKLNLSIDAVIYLNVDCDLAMKRALGRITCPKCKKTYHKYNEATKPKINNICDDCNVELVGRSDDNEESFKVRFNTYINNTEPLLNYYKELGKLVVIDKNDTPDETFEEVKKVI